MRILWMDWDSLGREGIYNEFKRRGYEVEHFILNRTEDMRLNREYAEKMIRFMAGENFDLVFSYNYFPVVSIACNACRVKYVSWVYDSPVVALYSNTIVFPYNYVFIFDKAAYLDLLKLGINTVYYLPMATDIKTYDGYEMDQSIYDVYAAPISFVGSTYSEKKHRLYNRLQNVDDYTRGYLEGIVQAQKKLYGELILEELLTPDIMEEIETVQRWTMNEDGFERPAWVFAQYYLARRVTTLERREILQMLSEKYRMVLYTNEKTPHLPKVENRGPAGRLRESVYIYRCSEINLNMSLRSIVSGMPYRIFEIMGSGGFLLSNYQEDFLEYFVPGEDFDYYTSYEDLMEKVEYYLSHKKERKEIARNGYEKIKKYHSFEKRLDLILDIIKEERKY